MAAPSRSRHRNFTWTWNSPPDDLSALLALPTRYLCYGKETAPSTGRPHLQGFVSFSSAKTLSAAIKLLPGCHVAVSRGTAAQNRDYCSKEGDFFERGECPATPADGGSLERARWDQAWTLAKAGRLEDIDADIRLRYYATIRKIGMDYMPSRAPLESTCGIWIFGESGCGKTRAVMSTYPDAYPKPRNTWWDGYQDEDIVLLDDVDKFNVSLGGYLKHWADFCPFIGERKGGSIKIRPKKFIVTSQYRIEDIWLDDETREALARRFVVIEKIAGQDIII